MSNEINLPHGWAPRPYQCGEMAIPGDWKSGWGAWGAMEAGCKRVILLWHRRAGKDLVALNRTIIASQERVGIYWHLFPTAKQGKKNIWEGMTNDGRSFLDFWPAGMIAKKNETEMKLRLTNGSLWQVVGADNWEEALVGGNPVGVVISEFAIMRPSVWDIGLRPILRANKGWAIFAYTPRGRNHGHKLYEAAKASPDWFVQRLSIEDSGLLSPEDLDKERAEGMAEEVLQQEYYCSFEAGLVGAYYADLLAKARAENRITAVPYDPRYPVETWWDIGTGDETSIWFKQTIGMQTRLIDYYSKAGKGVDHFAGVLAEKGYSYKRHIGPHDLKQREWGGGGRSRKDQAQSLGLRFEVAPKLSVRDGINAVRALMPQCWFDAEKCGPGIDALNSYTKDYDEEKRTFKDEPRHDWASHGADAFRTGTVMQRAEPKSGPTQTEAITDENPRGSWTPGSKQQIAIMED